MNRRKSRELAMKLTYEMSINKQTVDEMLDIFQENSEAELSEIDMNYLLRVLKGIEGNMELIDKKIQEKLTNWKLERLSKIDLAIIRIAVYEILFEEDIPPIVSVNEAVELAKKFSPDVKGSFVNGVLDNFM